MTEIAFATFAAFAVQSAVLAVVDVRRHRLPDLIVLPGYGFAAVLVVDSALRGNTATALHAAVAAVTFFTCALTLHVLHSPGLGGGDVKLAGVVGAFAGWVGTDAIVAVVGAIALLGGLAAAAVLAARARAGPRDSLSTIFAFGPVMLAGGWWGILTSLT